MDEEELEKAVLSFLKKKGFKQTELAFQEEQQHQHTKNNSSTISSANSQSDPDFSRHLLAFSEYVILSPLSPRLFIACIAVYCFESSGSS